MNPEELGCLTGGPARAAEVALARLLHAGLVRISRDGVASAVNVPGRGPSSPLEAQILNGLRYGLAETGLRRRLLQEFQKSAPDFGSA